jgi:hypothetical protein
MAKTAASGANGRSRTSNTNGTFNSVTSNNGRGSGPMNENPNSNNEVNQRAPRPTKSFSPSTGMRLGNSQVSGETSYNTAVNQNAAATSMQRQQQSKSPSSYKSAKSERTMQRILSAGAAETRRTNIVTNNVLNTFKSNVNDMGNDLPRNISGQIEKGLKNKQITREKLSRLKELLNKGKSKIANKQRQQAANANAAAKAKAAANANAAAKAKAAANANAAAKAKAAAKRKAEAATNNRERVKTMRTAAATAKANRISERTTISEMKELLKKLGVTNVNLGRSKRPYITALEKFGITLGPQTTRTSAATGGRSRKRPAPTPAQVGPSSKSPASGGPSKRFRTAGQGASVFLRNKQRLTNEIMSSSLNNQTKENLTKNLNSGAVNINKVREKFYSLKNPVVKNKNPVVKNKNPVVKNKNPVVKNKKSKAGALIKLYKLKLTVRNRITNNMEDVMSKQITKFNISTGRASTESPIDSDTFVNLLLIMWLDGIHDKYINMTFKEWLDNENIRASFSPNVYSESPMFKLLQNLRINQIKKHTKKSNTPMNNRLQLFILETRLNNKSELKEVLNGYLEWIIDKEQKILNEQPGVTSTFIEPFINNLGFTQDSTFKSFKAGWEKNFKYFLIDKYREKNNIVERVKRIRSNDNNNIFLLAIDQEYSTRQERPLTSMIMNSGESVQSLVTYGQAFDPGSTMLPEGIVPDLQNITVRVLEPEKQELQNQPASLSPKPWYYLEDFEIRLKIGGSSVMKIDFNAQESELKLNDKTLSLTVTAGAAGKSNDPFFQLGKYFGDGLQYFIASWLTKNKPTLIKLEGKPKQTAFHSFLGSGDGMALFGYDFVCTKLYKASAPNMVIDFSGQSNPIAHIVNFPSNSFTVEQVPVNNRQGIENNNNYNPNRTTQQAQTSLNRTVRGNNGNTAQSNQKGPKANSPK